MNKLSHKDKKEARMLLAETLEEINDIGSLQIMLEIFSEGIVRVCEEIKEKQK